MSVKYSGENVLTYLLSLLNTKFKSKVDKEVGKGLSTNDYTTADKDKLAGIADNANNYSHPAYTQRNEGLYKVTVDAQGHVSNVSAVEKADITALGIPAQDTTYSDATESAAGLMPASAVTKLKGIEADIEVLNGTESTTGSVANTVKTYVDGRLASAYKAAGSSTFAALPTPSAANEGYVYNVTDAFTTDAKFVDAANGQYAAGTNVVVVEVSEGVYKFDVLAGFVDLSNYMQNDNFAELSNTEVQAIWDSVFAG